MLETKIEKTVGKLNFTPKQFLRDFGIIFAFLLLIVVLSSLNSNFLEYNNIINVVRQVAINGLLAIGMTYVILTGGIDLSVGSILAFSGVVSASLVTGDSELPVLLAVLVGIMAGSILGFINGFIIARFNVAAFVATLAMMSIARGLTMVYSNGNPISGLSDGFKFIGGGELIGIPIPVIILFIVFVLGAFILQKTRFGRYVYAVGGNETSARVSGIKVNRVKIAVYTISGMLSGLAGVVLSARVTAGLPQAGTAYELDAIAAVVIGGTSLVGGRGRLWGTIIGVLIIGVLSNGLDLLNVSSYFQMIVKGIIIIAAVLFDSKVNKG
ncbi:ABC transporter permease [Aquibacillus sediminis]|uniref:ABC transporter permease n=1 Tax=Aquibacillus sediminis TaxID=2574734 RepID=UPI0011095C52|nr:ribose ABC transporter permease [Aquibacillus sediminis]